MLERDKPVILMTSRILMIRSPKGGSEFILAPVEMALEQRYPNGGGMQYAGNPKDDIRMALKRYTDAFALGSAVLLSNISFQERLRPQPALLDIHATFDIPSSSCRYSPPSTAS
jgi:hypothetical protein